MHDPECPICRVVKATAPYRTKDRRGNPVEHPEPKPQRKQDPWELYDPNHLEMHGR